MPHTNTYPCILQNHSSDTQILAASSFELANIFERSSGDSAGATLTLYESSFQIKLARVYSESALLQDRVRERER